MSDKRSRERMDDLRERLYSRGEAPRPIERTPLRTTPIDQVVTKPPIVPPPPTPPPPVAESQPAPRGGFVSNKLRWTLLIVGIAFFLLSLLASSLYMMFGQNTISGSNITLGISGPFTVSGGDVIPLQIGVTNSNSLPIESAVVLIEFPAGTRSGDDENRELRSERVPLEGGLAPGETYNLPVKARVFGEENQESSIRVSIEYRVSGSSATFYKEAAPHRFKIGSAPVSLKIEAEKAISSGQETTVKMTITSNSSSPITNLLVKADYPRGFEFTSSEPAPISGRNIWRIDELKPEESVTINVSGIIIGTESEKYVMRFTSGVSSDRGTDIGSVLAVSDTEFTLENPFLSVDVRVGNDSSETVTIAPGSQATVSLSLRNTLNTAVYDGEVLVKLSGNALSDTDVSVNTGYYDSNSKTVRFNVSEISSLRRLNPDSTVNLTFSLRPETAGVATPQITMDVSASARRVSENSARENISGTIKRVIKVESRPVVAQEVLKAESGPVPPKVGQTTKYQVEWKVINSANSISGSVVTAALPSYVSWTGETSGAGAWSFNPSTRTVEWRAGSVNAGGTVSGTFMVDFLPSASLAGRTPTLVEAAHLRSDDNFTGSVLRNSSNALTTEINGSRDSGTVQN